MEGIGGSGGSVPSMTTWINACADASPEVAVIRVVPFDTAITRPPASTVATSGRSLDHITAAPGMAAPPESYTWASSCRLWPAAESVASEMLSTMRAGSGAISTWTGRDVETPPDEAVIRADPGDTAVTRPLASTVAISGSLLDHTTATPGMGRVFAS